MRPILYPPGTTDFTNLGVGKLRDTISAEVYEARNGAFTLEIEYPVNGVYFDQIKDFSYIKAKPNDRDDYHTFLVYEVAKSTTSRSVIVKATTKTDEIGNTLVTMTNTGNPQTLLNAMKTNALDPISYNMYSDISTSKKVEWLRRNPLNALVGESGSLVDLFGGELKRTDSTIFLYQRRGNDKVAKFTARRGLKGAKIVVSTASIVTRILPYITILGGAEEEDVTLTGTIVNSPLVNNYPVRPLVPVDFGMIDDSIDTLAKLNAKAATYFTSLYPEIDKPKVSVDLDLLSLQDTSDYAQFKAVEKIELCDTIDVYLPKYDVVRTVKVTELYYDSLREINTRIVAGDKAVSQIDAFKREYNGQVNSIKDHLSKVENTMMVKGDGTQIWSGPDTPPPDKVNINDIWWKKTGEDTWALLIWNGLIWEDMLSDEIFKEIDIRIDQAETDIAQNVLDIEASLAKATQAELDAGFSKDLAEEAKALGVTASSLAGEAKTNANTAMADALEAIRQVELNEGVVADSSADSAEARRLAGLAEANAQEAKTNAGTAIADAEEALRQVALNGGVAADANAEAVEARRLAGLAEGNAQEALTKANTAVTDSSTALTNATKAFNKSIKSTAIAYTTSTNGSTPPTTGWGTTVPSPSPDVYIWTRTTIVLNDNTPVVSYSVGKIGAKGDQGLKGDTGGQGIQGIPGVNAPTIKSVVQQFYLSTSNSTQTGGSWLATVPVWSSGKYYWRRVVTTYSNNATSTSTPVLDNALNDSLITALEVKTANQTLSTTVTQHATLIEGKASSTTVDAIAGRVTTTEGSISTIAGQVALKASTADVNTLTGRVTTAEGNITTQAGQIALRATTATVNTLTGRVSTAEGKITTQAGLIELKADTTTVNTLTGRVSAAEASLSVQSGKIDLAATKTELTTAIDGIEIGGRNLLVSGTLNRLSNQMTEKTTKKLKGYGTYYFDFGTSFNPNTEYTVSNSNILNDGTLYPNSIMLVLYDTSGATYRWTIGTMTSGSSVTFKTPSTTSETDRLYFYVSSVATVNFEIDDLKLEKGNKATDWSPAPEDVDSAISTVQANLTVEAGKIASKVSQTDFNALNGRVGTAESTITQHTTAIALRATKTDLDATTGRVTTAEGTIQVQAGQIALKASQTSVDSLTGRVGTAETNITANTTAINLRATKTSVDTLTGRVSTAEGSITTQAGQIALRATTATVNALTGRVSTAESTISANTTAINLRATKTELTTAIDGIEVGGRNLLVNSGNTITNGSYNIAIYDLTIPPSQGDLVTVTIKGKLAATKSHFGVYNSGGGVSLGSLTSIGGGLYTRTFNWSIGTSNNTKLYVYAFTNAQVGSSTIEWIKLEKGNKATDWSPAPEDVDASIATVQANLTVEAGKITALTTRVSGSETNISNVTQTVSGINTTISTLRTDVNGKATIVSLNEVKSTADGNKTTISNHSGRLTTVETNVNGLQTTVSNKAEQSQVTQLATAIELRATKTDVNALTGRVSTAEGKITTQAGQIDLKANTTTVNTLTGRVATAEGNITTQAGLIALKANQSVVDTLTGRVSTTESKITATDGKVTTLTTKTDGHTTSIGLLETSYSGLSSTVTALETGKVGTVEFSALEQNLSGFKTTVQNTYADKTTVNQLAGQWQTTTTLANGHTSQIASLGTDLNLRATKTELLDSMGVTNLITNGGNIQSTAGWYGPVALSKHTFYKGNTANLLYLTTAGTTEITASGEYFNIEPNTKYTVKFTGFAAFNVSSMDLWFLSRKKTSSKTYDNDLLLTSTRLNSGGLDTRTITFTTNSTDDQAYIRFDNNGSTNMGNAGLYIVDIILVKGEVVPDRWFESPSDTIMSQINISPESILIASKKIQIKGDTYIDNGVIKTAHIADLAVSGAKIANASIASAKIISLDASKITATSLSAITTNTGTLNVSGNLTMTSDNTVVKGAYDYREAVGTAYTPRRFIGSSELGRRYLGYFGNVYSESNSFLGYAETFFGLDYFKMRWYDTDNARNLQSRIDMLQGNIEFGQNWGQPHTVIGTGGLLTSKYIASRGYQAYTNEDLFLINNGRPDLADFRIGKDGSGKVVGSFAIYNRTYSSASNVYVTEFGSLGRAVSARKYKASIQIEHLTKSKKVLQLNPSSWYDKVELANGKATKRHYGFIADEFDELGLKEVVQYGTDGQVEGLAYDRISMYHNVILQDHEQQLKSLDSVNSNVIKLVANDSIYGLRLNNLESEVFRLKKRIEELEKIA